VSSGRHITKFTVDRLKPNTTVWDAKVRGFGVRKQRRDPFYILKYRAARKQRLYTIGRHGAPWTVDSARREAQRLLGELAKGTDPAVLRDKMKSAPLLSLFAERYVAEVSDTRKKASTAHQDRRILNLHILPQLGDRKIANIDRGDVARLHAKMRATPHLANRALALLSHMLNHAIDKGERPEGSNPCRKVKKYPEGRRERFLSVDELGRLGAAITEGETAGILWQPDPRKKIKHAPKEEHRNRAHISQHAAAAIRLLLFTGARLREILHLKWEYVDFERGLLLLPDSKTGKKTIVLNAPALAVLSSLPRVGSYVIAGEFAGTDKERPRADLNRPWRTVTKRAGLTRVRLHDLRHTFASYGAGASLGLPIVGKLLGHTRSVTTARYAHLETDPLRKATDLIGRRIAGALGSANGTAGNVAVLAPRRQ
jgi:integrase